MKKLIELPKEELKQREVDRELFIKLFPLFNSMSKRGKVATIETLSFIIGLDLVIKEEIRKKEV